MDWTDENDRELIELWPDKSRTVAELAAGFGMGETTLREHIRRLKLPSRMYGHAKSGWTPERVERLKAMYADKYTRSEMAAELGITRNAAIGKLFRLGLKEAERSTPRPPKVRKPRTKRIAPPPPPLTPCRPEPKLVMPAPIPGEAITILTVGDRQCRWPIDEVPSAHMRLCGAQVAEMSYCEAHARIAYQPVQARRRTMSRRSGGANG